MEKELVGFGQCFRCGGPLVWQSDFTCEEVSLCGCEEGIVTFLECKGDCEASYQVTYGCKQE